MRVLRVRVVVVVEQQRGEVMMVVGVEVGQVEDCFGFKLLFCAAAAGARRREQRRPLLLSSQADALLLTGS